MEALLLAIYSFFVWLIFFKFKWLPWNATSQVIVITLPIIGLTALILTLNVVAPSSADVRVLKYVININPQVRGRVIEVPVEPNRLVKKGEVLFKIDPTPYRLQVQTLEASLENAQGNTQKSREDLDSAVAKTRSVAVNLGLAKTRVGQNLELVKAGAGDRFALESAQTDVKRLEADLAASQANEASIRAGLNAKVGDDQAEVAQVRAQLAQAQWELDQTTLYAPADGYAINVTLRPGTMTAAFPSTPVMNFVEAEYQVIALFSQNELRLIEPGDEAEFTLLTYPGQIIKAKVDSIVWAQGQGQVPMSTVLAQTGNAPIPPGRFPVKLTVEPKFRDLFLAAGAVGNGAVYTQSGAMIHIIRKVIVRVGAKLDYLVLKLH
ncbi:MAG TPA: HlyD family secretion protein [Pseudomonadales bacterium]|jgi:multidrug resistance efflux pump|nr:HlyD family secretion protein [Pseudomonadales bacterium]